MTRLFRLAVIFIIAAAVFSSFAYAQSAATTVYYATPGAIDEGRLLCQTYNTDPYKVLSCKADTVNFAPVVMGSAENCISPNAAPYYFDYDVSFEYFSPNGSPAYEKDVYFAFSNTCNKYVSFDLSVNGAWIGGHALLPNTSGEVMMIVCQASSKSECDGLGLWDHVSAIRACDFTLAANCDDGGGSNAVPSCSINLSPTSLPSSGGIVTAQANCTNSPTSYSWTINQTAYPNVNSSMLSLRYQANTTSDAYVYTYVVQAKNSSGTGSASATFTEAAGNGGATMYTVTPSAGANGSISPSTMQTVSSGATAQFTVTPNSGYTASVGGSCGGALSGNTYTTNPILANCTVAASFTAGGTTPPPTGNFTSTIRTAISNDNSCVDVSGLSSADGTQIQQWACTGGSNQSWVFTSLAGGLYKIQTALSDKCLDVTGSSTGDGTKTQEWTCTGGTNQQWQLMSLGSGNYKIQSALDTSKCLDVGGGSPANGARIQIMSCNPAGAPAGNLAEEVFAVNVGGGSTSPPSGSFTSAIRTDSSNSTGCLDVTNLSTADGARIQQWDCTGGSNQNWLFTPVGNGVYQIQSSFSGKCLDVTGASRSDGASIQQWTCNGAPNQTWALQSSSVGLYTLRPESNSNECLDVTAGSASNGTKLQQWTCNSFNSQLFSINVNPGVPNPSSFTNVIHTVVSGGTSCIDVSGVSSADGTQIQEWTCTGGQNQSWIFTPVGNAYQIQTALSGKCLDIAYSSTADGAKIQEWPCTGNPNQLWALTSLGGASYEIQSALSGNKCLDVAGISSANGTKIQEWTCNGLPSQEFSLSN